MTTRREFLKTSTAVAISAVIPAATAAKTVDNETIINQQTNNHDNLTVNHIFPDRRQGGEFTFSVVDNNKKASVAFYPASQLKHGIQSTPEQVLSRFYADHKPGTP